MIFYGWGKKSVPLADMGMRSCPQCGDFRPFRVVLNYSYFNLYWIFGVVTRKRYIAACNICSRGALVEKSQIGSIVTEEPIPFMDKWGLAILAAAGLTVIAALATR